MRNKLALIGKDISHSKSPVVYTDILKIDADYVLLDYENGCDIPCLKSLLATFSGISVTAPYKRYIYELCDEIHSSAEKVKAVNCFYMEDAKVVGANTDLLALEVLLKDYRSYDNHYILGNGAMADVISYILKKKSVRYKQFARSLGHNLSTLSFESVDKLIIYNCCAREFIFDTKLKESTTFFDLN